MSDCKCFNVEDVINNLHARLITELVGYTADKPTETYLHMTHMLSNVITPTIERYRDEIVQWQEEVRSG